MKKIAIFGSTGSIGRQTLEVLRALPGEFEVVGLTAKNNIDLLTEQAESLRAQNLHVQTFLNPDSSQIRELMTSADYVVNAVPGFDGLAISLATVRAGKTLLSANKESLAIAGRYLRAEAQKTSAEIRPLDSEASAIWQLLGQAELHSAKWNSKKNVTGSDTLPKKHQISSVTLTCSGGPFYGKTTEELHHVTVQEALAHPTWKMGPKVSVDSATLINKVLEVYEVHHLFDIPLRNIHIVIHPQSLVHSMIHTKTGATKMHLTQNDMRLFISYALHYPKQPVCPWPIRRARKSGLSFEQPDASTFRSLNWLNLHRGNPNFPIVLNALNDHAVSHFLRGERSFLGIYDFIENGLARFLWETPPDSLEKTIRFHHRVSAYASDLLPA